jgi:hypothetical protein
MHAAIDAQRGGIASNLGSSSQRSRGSNTASDFVSRLAAAQ